MKRWYRGNLGKGILVAVEYVTLILAVICGIFLIDQYSKGNLISMESIRAGAYSATEGFSDTIYEMSTSIFDALRSEEWLDTTNEDGTEKVIDLEEVLNGETLTYQNKSGLAYSMKDLLDWVKSGVIYDDESIIVCKNGDGTYDYYYYSEFYQLVKNGKLHFVVDIDQFGDENEAEREILETLENGIYYEGISMGLQGVTDRKGNVQYVEIWNFNSDTHMKEKYQPVGAGSILEIVNEDPNWNGRLGDAYRALARAMEEISSAMSMHSHFSEYDEGNTNMTYLFVDKTAKKLYTNKNEYRKYEDYKDSVEKIRRSDCHLIIVPKLSDCETTMNTNLQTWREMVEMIAPGRQWFTTDYISEEDKLEFDAMDSVSESVSTAAKTQNSDYIYAVSVDTKYPIEDVLFGYNKNYEKYAGILIPAMVGFVLSVLLFLAGLVLLTITAGRRPNDSQLYLHPFDKWFTEVAAGGVITLWLISMCIVVEAGDGNHGLLVVMIWGIILTVITVTLFLIGYLSLVRRIKGKLLWKGSLTLWLIRFVRKYWRKCKTVVENLIREISKMTSSVVKIIAIFGGFLVFQLLLTLMIASGGGFLLILMLAADAAAMIYFVRRAMGRQMILGGLKKITDGELNYKIPTEKLKGEQRTMAEYINGIGAGLDAAVENSLKNERMKTELITNVSHDIKTPLTSIINYIDLLKREELEDPKVAGYLEVLESKAQRLKVLTEDVVEASKVSTGNISLEMTDLNLVEMLNQVMGEFQEKFDARQLCMVVDLSGETVIIHADGRRMWRVLANIFNNTAKYAMEGTRVYVDLKCAEGQAKFSLKNISAQPLNISADELTERFIRGDVSRSTEGSGLGLSIAKSLTELQGGSFQLYLDGDLFKVMIAFPMIKK